MPSLSGHQTVLREALATPQKCHSTGLDKRARVHRACTELQASNLSSQTQASVAVCLGEHPQAPALFRRATAHSMALDESEKSYVNSGPGTAPGMQRPEI